MTEKLTKTYTGEILPPLADGGRDLVPPPPPEEPGDGGRKPDRAGRPYRASFFGHGTPLLSQEFIIEYLTRLEPDTLPVKVSELRNVIRIFTRIPISPDTRAAFEAIKLVGTRLLFRTAQE